MHKTPIPALLGRHIIQFHSQKKGAQEKIEHKKLV